MDIHSVIGLRIKNRRKELGLSGANLANKLHLSQQQISRYENGVNKIPIDHLLDIAEILMCPIEWFFNGYKSEINNNDDHSFDIPNRELQYAAESVIIPSKHHA
ncbi:helix-turn-helix domain-containing protein [Providencia sp. PROV188]|jgi:transcriptional regulator with XRE-family HTH domain|uniref:Transcriptional regulator with XRE-family HTH domain n=1 Tax=Providencia alcalifaciens TaxID=126385 RepID=A0A4R3NMT2_9GAMM|nr:MULTISPECIES: helix-turn-helix transcriptional regulator [Providencia]MBC5790358.1 helix-turn-helix transcriptional regulator [Providencia sp. JUb39]MBS0932507.1 helix-turn-helix transcriptional regulator [Providencia sp. JGM172]MBS0996700.1 helix-turn-helix transcriptional regulator [Providencia sp. JGM178]MDR2241249.1 helix-turn-helix domain-containing protein [Providencia alcalifaciens]MTB65747.1 helix-turn-helix domain-containing protein [Providencia sp. wls1943]